MSTASVSNRSCVASGPARAPGCGLRSDRAINGCISMGMFRHRAERPVGCSCRRSIPRPFPSRLSAFAQEQGVGPDKHLLLVLDQAGWHKSADLKLPQGLHLLFLPSHSPELQPAERLWPLSNEPLANRVVTSLDELEQLQAERCCWLQAHPEMIRGRTSFHWWPALDTT
jgi:DDE superfamily endonuclease